MSKAKDNGPKMGQGDTGPCRPAKSHVCRAKYIKNVLYKLVGKPSCEVVRPPRSDSGEYSSDSESEKKTSVESGTDSSVDFDDLVQRHEAAEENTARMATDGKKKMKKFHVDHPRNERAHRELLRRYEQGDILDFELYRRNCRYTQYDGLLKLTHPEDNEEYLTRGQERRREDKRRKKFVAQDAPRARKARTHLTMVGYRHKYPTTSYFDGLLEPVLSDHEMRTRLKDVNFLLQVDYDTSSGSEHAYN